VVITDHHDLPPSLPAAKAVVNPKRLPAGHPLATLPGVGVAYKLVEELYRRGGRSAETDLYLDLVALGIVADIALLWGDARYLLQQGLHALRETRRPGLRAIFELAGLEPQGLTEEHIGFVVAPRLNALGRLGDANPAVSFLNTQDQVEARVVATRLEGLNAERKLLTDQVFRSALAQLERDPTLLETPVLVLSHPAWNAGVIGIVASRLVDQFQRPAVLLAAPPGGLARGSARSVAGIDISAAIADQGELLESHGGHPMAAGLSLYPERIPELRRGLARAVMAMLDSQPLVRSLAIDAYLPLGELSLEVAGELERLGPFGAGNPAPVLVAPQLVLSKAATIGKSEEHLKLDITDEDGETYEAIWWGGAGWPLPQGAFDLAYLARTRSFRGERRLQIEWLAWRPAEGASVVTSVPVHHIAIHDHRATARPLETLERLLAQALEPGEVQVWAEGAEEGVPGAVNRTRLERAPTLVIWTSPPGPRELADAIKAVQPAEVHLIGVDAHTGSLQAFLGRLAGLLKYTLHKREGRASVRALAGATGQREETVRLGTAWLEARGQFVLLPAARGEIQVAAGDGKAASGLAQVATDLEALLKETEAYRAHFLRAPKDALIPPLNGLDEGRATQAAT
jgi:single-stranded-DNA-specific exonuclease